ncbi:hypothetical protein [Pseudonocardia alni]|uniref:Uncharacterized protein n=1 Tax=Pseudonocardia alni TaxID=33907 RepID=A0A852VYF6_PSEA5|nr:hypothetical protein [Pseudonocardia antarctica]NYG00351.1 hypothetical protein [Pseudonocardia antarctica]
MPDQSMPLHEASAILRGVRGVTTLDDRDRATARVLAALDRQLVVSIWARRLLDATDDATADRARRRLREALDQLQP